MTTKLLTKDEWGDVKPPVYWTRVQNKTWGKVHRDMIAKWIEAHCGKSWVYYDGDDTYCFGSAGDQTYFAVWIKSDPFDGKDDGVIDVE